MPRDAFKFKSSDKKPFPLQQPRYNPPIPISLVSCFPQSKFSASAPWTSPAAPIDWTPRSAPSCTGPRHRYHQFAKRISRCEHKRRVSPAWVFLYKSWSRAISLHFFPRKSFLFMHRPTPPYPPISPQAFKGCELEGSVFNCHLKNPKRKRYSIRLIFLGLKIVAISLFSNPPNFPFRMFRNSIQDRPFPRLF